MSKPDFVIKRSLRTEGGALSTSIIQRVRSKLMKRGFVLLPSDTCYSLAALAADERTRRAVNSILQREDWPISLAFSSYLAVQQLIDVDNTVALLLERYTPGPITLVCKAKDDVSAELLSGAVGSADRTIGVRIPDSHIERDIAASMEYPLMSVAVRDPKTGEAIRNFDRAIQVVSSGTDRFGAVGWGALEGDGFYASHSTVVRVDGSEGVSLIREGDTAFEEILSVAKSDLPSGLAMEDWT